MSTVTLLEKVYGSISPMTFEQAISSLCKGLRVKLRVVGQTNRGWIQIEVSGEDEIAALRFLDREIGIAPVSLGNLKRFSVMCGMVISSGKSKKELHVDVGVFSPKTCDAVLSLQKLQAQLADGRRRSIQELVETFGLYDNFPLKVKVVRDASVHDKCIEAELSAAQLSQFTSWIQCGLDRLIVLGEFSSGVERAVSASKHSRDVIRVEPLGMFEHAALCKLGTDAVGLVPKLGRLLPDAALIPFSLRRIRRSIGRFSL